MKCSMSMLSVLLAIQPLMAGVEASEARHVRDDDPGFARRVLAMPVKHVALNDVPFEDVVSWLKSHGSEAEALNVVVKWRRLDLEGVDRDTPVEIDLRQTTVERVLVEVLDQLSDLDPITFEAEENIIKISTASDFASRMATRIYNVDDLLARIRHFGGAPQIDIAQPPAGGGGGGGGGGAVENLFAGGRGGGGDDNQPTDRDDAEMVAAIVNVIQRTVEPDSWEVAGGLGRIDVFNGHLVVRNNRRVHNALAGPR